MAILTFLPVKPLSHSCAAPNRDVTCGLCQRTRVTVLKVKNMTTSRLHENSQNPRCLYDAIHCLERRVGVAT